MGHWVLRTSVQVFASTCVVKQLIQFCLIEVAVKLGKFKVRRNSLPTGGLRTITVYPCNCRHNTSSDPEQAALLHRHPMHPGSRRNDRDPDPSKEL